MGNQRIELDREVIAALAGALRPRGADLCAADKDPVAWRVVAGPAGLRNDADAFGLDAEGDDLALELVAGLLEGTDGCHVVSPWLFEPATIAASMAIDRPQAIDDAPAGPECSGGWRRRDFLGSRGMGEPGSPRAWEARGGEPGGRKAHRRHCGKAIGAQPSGRQIKPSRGRGARARGSRASGRR